MDRILLLLLGVREQLLEIRIFFDFPSLKHVFKHAIYTGSSFNGIIFYGISADIWQLLVRMAALLLRQHLGQQFSIQSLIQRIIFRINNNK